MSFHFEVFRSFQFDGELHARVTSSSANDVAVITYNAVCSEGNNHSVSGNVNEAVVFEDLPPADYRVSAEISFTTGKQAVTLEKTLSVHPEEKTRTLRAALANHPTLNQLAGRLPTINNSSKASLKGHLSLGTASRHTLCVMFEENGLEKLNLNMPPEVGRLFAQDTPPAFAPVVRKREALLARKGRGKVLQRFLNLYYLDSKLQGQNLLQLATALEKIDYIEYCALMPSATADDAEGAEVGETNILGTQTPDFEPLQLHLNAPSAEMKGLNIRKAWEKARGRGMSLHVPESNGVYPEHEDLMGQMTVVTAYPDHFATSHADAVTALIVAADNQKGVTGIACEAHAYTYTTYFDYYEILTIGDILEHYNPTDMVSMSFSRDGFMLLHQKPWWDFANTLKAAGGMVFIASGNNGKDILNDPGFADWGDSGGIAIGSCHNTTGRRYDTSSYNFHRMLNAWGTKAVVTAGFGDLFKNQENPSQNYTATFGQSSCATPMTAASCALVQSFVKERFNIFLDAKEMYDLVSASGHADAEGEQIGIRPDAYEAMSILETLLAR
ncbi:S8 family serine peptidase [Pseudomonas sp. NPDC089554]|uniref:S8 family serine peptidase n=1 Tax=Pseudomonas sp. NPDC089554 TaxID=3390653 RepID=UPI003CFE3E95